MRRFAPWGIRSAAIFLALFLAYVGLVGVRAFYPIAYTAQIAALAEEYGLDPELIGAVVRCESRFDVHAVSPRGAIGLMQIMPETGSWIAEQLAVPDFRAEQLSDAALNLRLGTWYLRHLLDRFGSREVALAAYNAGPSHAERWVLGIGSPFPETRAYVERVARAVPIYRIYFRAPWLLTITPCVLL